MKKPKSAHVGKASNIGLWSRLGFGLISVGALLLAVKSVMTGTLKTKGQILYIETEPTLFWVFIIALIAIGVLFAILAAHKSKN